MFGIAVHAVSFRISPKMALFPMNRQCTSQWHCHLYRCIILIISLFLFSVNAIGKDPVLLPFEIMSVKADAYMLPLTPYNLDGLEPYIDAATVTAHYEGHHDAYRKKMNAALSEWRNDDVLNRMTTQPIVDILRNIATVPEKFQQKLRNNGGGYVNHLIYFSVMSPNPDGSDRAPTGELMDDIEGQFGSFFAFKIEFFARAMELFGSGYVWLVRSPPDDGGKLAIISTRNQDSPICDALRPLLVVDLWEHAYYLKHQYRRASHLEDWWKVVDWERVALLDKYWTKLDERERDEL